MNVELLEPMQSPGEAGRTATEDAPAVVNAPRGIANSIPIGGGLTAACVCRREELAALAEDWNRLAADVPFRRWEWLDSWWQHMSSPDDELFVITVRDGSGRLVGLAPWYCARTRALGRVVRFLGSGIACSDYLTILCAAENRDAVAGAMVDYLAGSSADWDALELEAVERDDPAIQALVGRLQARRSWLARRANQHCWRLRLRPWDDYTKSLSGTRRSMARRIVNKVFGSHRAVVKCVEGEADFERGWRILVDLHQRRRQQLRQPGCFAQSSFEAFLKLAARRFLEMGRLRLQWVELDGQPAAVEIDFVGGNTLYMYQSGIEPNLMAERPGWLGTIAALRRAIGEGFQNFDFMRGDEPYKSHWRAEPVALVDLRLAAPGASARFRQCLWLATQVAKRAAKLLVAQGSRLRDGITKQLTSRATAGAIRTSKRQNQPATP